MKHPLWLFFQFLGSSLKWFKPPQLHHWKTLMLTSGFLWLASLFHWLDTYQNTLEISSGITLIWSIALLSNEKFFRPANISLTPWLVSTAICAVLMIKFNRPISIIIIWPLVAYFILLATDLSQNYRQIKNLADLVKPKYLILLLLHVLISCWLVFFLLIQSWLGDYPLLLVTNLKMSNFLIKFGPKITVSQSRGDIIVQRMEKYLQDKVQGKSWESTEKFFININQRQIKFSKAQISEELKKVLDIKEKDASMWFLEMRVIQGQSLHQVELLANWSGPSSNIKGYVFTRFCQVEKVANRSLLTCDPNLVNNLDLKSKSSVQPTNKKVNSVKPKPQPTNQLSSPRPKKLRSNNPTNWPVSPVVPRQNPESEDTVDDNIDESHNFLPDNLFPQEESNDEYLENNDDRD